MNQSPLAVVVLISGGGSNLQAFIDAQQRAELPIIIRSVISNNADAYGLERARRAGIATQVLDHRTFFQREQFDAALINLIDQAAPELVLLAGFMRILTPVLVNHYDGRLLNIHPSLLPKLRGLHTHARALANGEVEHGASIHFVTAELDGGPVIAQARVPVLKDDDANCLAARVLIQEHRLYPRVVRWFAQRRLQLNAAGIPELDGVKITTPLLLDVTAPE
ncbi:phosphoribosylglycinamide formyltransferase [Rhodoferax sp. 4810]|uniref:Phosphoribosylglycinamide formyltransferase n=1 Tax=Thiospirillum jenense TaxID=1653858 RepID=A0A839H686_9GAMM|nr:phosphoribosylglycinamide formyltransferase [Thiospirillum jenense]MBB1072996.1 phosphoribosylglycinamide formyltransferase [Rhodoferax jenense]MBB1124944.1 phosphoribosylglycinamide formyltransferase [Thiospirillum jenense]